MREDPRTTARDAFGRLLEIVSILRSDEGCPWDREQTHESLRSELLEEAYEFLEALELGSRSKMAEELGDLMIVLSLHAQIAKESGEFQMLDALNAVNSKLVRRHPHVFGSVDVETTDEVLRNWEAIKGNEAGYEARTSALDGVPVALPALLAAFELQKKAARVGFDWDRVEDVLAKVREELGELEAAVDAARSGGDVAAVEAEMGDLLFSAVNLSRFVDVDAEAALRGTNRKFTRRFRQMEAALEAQGKRFEDQSLAELDALWERAKEEEASVRGDAGGGE